MTQPGRVVVFIVVVFLGVCMSVYLCQHPLCWLKLTTFHHVLRMVWFSKLKRSNQKFAFAISNCFTLGQMVTALEALGQLDRKIQTLGRQLAQYIFFGLALRWQKVVVTETPLTQGKQVVIKAASESKQPTCVDVFSIVGNILDLLNDSLLHVEVKRRAGQDAARDSKITLMNLLGEEIGEKVSGLCLQVGVCACM